MKVETQAIARSVRMSPRKVRLVVDLVRGKLVGEADTQLRLLKNWAAKPVRKLLASAVANATHNHQMSEASLRIVRASVDGGMTVKRFMPRAMGRGVPIRHRTSHITIVLSGEAPEKKEKKATAVGGAPPEGGKGKREETKVDVGVKESDVMGEKKAKKSEKKEEKK